MTDSSITTPPSRESREYQIIRALVDVENRGKATGQEFKALHDVGIDIFGHFAYLYCNSNRADVIDKMCRGEIYANYFNAAVIHWANGYETDEESKQKR